MKDLTPQQAEERLQELIRIARQISAGIRIFGNEVHCQGRSWKLPADSPLRNASSYL